MAKTETKTKKDYENLGRMVSNIYESGYLDHNQTYKMSFIKGLLGGLGGVIGATVIVALLLGLLGFFKNIDPLKPFIEKTTDTIQQR